MKPVFIYALKDPVTEEVRYIGKTTDPTKRFSRHLTDAKTEKCHRASWIRFLSARGLKPILEMLAQVPECEWQQWEIDYIAAFRSMGCDLVNSTDGGEAGPIMAGADNPFFGKTHSPEALAKIIAANTGIKLSPESIAKREATRRKKGLNPYGYKPGKIPWNKGIKGKKLSPESITKRTKTQRLNREKKKLWQTNLLSLLLVRSQR